MCYHFQQLKSPKQVESRFNAKIKDLSKFEPLVYNGFTNPLTPIITNDEPTTINHYEWGLLPSWIKDIASFRKKTNTLNAKIETIDKLPSYKDSINNRCLIIGTSYNEWHWNDEKGKSKDKYEIFSQEDELFAFAGIYSIWINPGNGEKTNTYTMLTTEANELMRYVHNNKKRMPVVLKKQDELAWLDSTNNFSQFAFPYESNIVGFKV